MEIINSLIWNDVIISLKIIINENKISKKNVNNSNFNTN